QREQPEPHGFSPARGRQAQARGLKVSAQGWGWRGRSQTSVTPSPNRNLTLLFPAMSRSIQRQAIDIVRRRQTVVVQDPLTQISPANYTPVEADPPAARPGPGERAEIEALVAREYPGSRLHLTRRTGDAHVAADLLNEAIVTTWEKWAAGRIAEPRQIV